MNSVKQRKFIPGDEWIYFKIYGGPDTVESILILELNEIIRSLLDQEIIDLFFFIRYADPDNHLRIRFHVRDLANITIVIQIINQSLRKFIDSRHIWSLQLDTYSREIERYGSDIITEIETIFSYNSIAILSFLKSINQEESLRWMWGLKTIDLLLDEFGYLIEDKISLFEKLNKNYHAEFKVDTFMSKQIDQKYRNEIINIRETIESQNINIFSQEFKYIVWFIKQSKESIFKIINYYKSGAPSKSLDEVLASVIHMHFNRLFRSRQRMQELVIYHFLHKYYVSKLARNCIKMANS